MSTVISIDPGVHRSGCARWRNGRLVWCGLIVSEAELDLDLTKDPNAVVVIEKPKVYDVAHQKGDQRDIVDLAIAVGGLRAQFRREVYAVHLVEPGRWKGQVPKAIHHERARRELSDDELRLVLPQKDVLDAVALGLWYLGRLGGAK